LGFPAGIYAHRSKIFATRSKIRVDHDSGA
jgi:hypothetical protein